MTKIIVTLGSWGAGGAERVCSSLSKPLCDNYDKVIFITWENREKFYDFDRRATWYRIDDNTKNEFQKLKKFREIVKSEDPDLIMSFCEPFNLRTLISTLGLNVKIVVAERNEPHSVNKYWWMDAVERFIYRRADHILVQTPTIKKFFKGKLGEKTSIIYNPVNIDSNMVGKSLKTLKNKRIVSVARLKPQKNPDILMRSFSIFAKTHPEYTLTYYGSGPMENELKKLADRLNISDKVVFAGPSKTIHRDILNAEMMCLVSSREGMSNSMIEAMSLGLPCICTKVSGAVDLINDKVNGLLVDIGDINGLTKAMNLIADNPDYAYRVGKNASDIYSILNKDKIYAEWIQTLKRI